MLRLNVSASNRLKEAEMNTLGKQLAETTEERIRAILAKPYWDYEEAALVLNLDVKTLRNMKWKREITFTKFGHKVYLSRQEILGELKQNMVLSPVSAARGKRRAG